MLGLFDVCGLLCVVCCSLVFVVCCLFLLFGVRCSSFVVRCRALLCNVCLLFVVCCCSVAVV